MEIVFLIAAVFVAIAAARRVATRRSRRIAAVVRRIRAVDPWAEAARALRLGRPAVLPGPPRRMTGRVDGFDVIAEEAVIDDGGEGRAIARFRLSYPRPLGIGLHLSRETPLARLGRDLGEQDIEVGDARFDEDVTVKSSDVAAARAFLNPARRLRCQRFLALHEGAVIADAHITWVSPEAFRDPQAIAATVRRMVHVARHLVEDREDDRAVERAIEERRAGHLERALEIVRSVEASRQADDRGDEHVLEAEMLLLAGRSSEAREALAEAEDEPDVAALRGWAERAARGPAPGPRVEREPRPAARPEGAADSGPRVASPPATVAASGALAEAEAAPDEDAATVESDAVAPLDSRDVCEHLFDPRILSVDATRRFEESYSGRRVRWSGKLARLEGYTSDYVFGRGAGLKAMIELGDVAAPICGRKKVTAIVQLAPDAREGLEGRLGEDVVFEGRLHRVDGFVGNLYVADACCPVPAPA